MASKNTRSMFFALLLCLGVSGSASAQQVASVSAPTVAPASMPVTSNLESPEAATAVSTPEATVIAPVVIEETIEEEKGLGGRLAHWAHSTVLYQRMYVRITLRSTPEWRAR
jgi:hypothetical protein